MKEKQLLQRPALIHTISEFSLLHILPLIFKQVRLFTPKVYRYHHKGWYFFFAIEKGSAKIFLEIKKNPSPWMYRVNIRYGIIHKKSPNFPCQTNLTSCFRNCNN